MNDWVIIDELINKYSSVIDFRHKNIKKTGLIVFIIGAIFEICFISLIRIGNPLQLNLNMNLFFVVIIHAIGHLFFWGGFSILFFYWFWHIIIQAMKGVKQICFFIISIFLTIITIFAIPFTYTPIVSDSIHVTSKAFIIDDLSFAISCITEKEFKDERIIFLSDSTIRQWENLYYCVSFENEKYLLSYNDYTDISESHYSALKCSFNPTTRIIDEYENIIMEET